MSITHVPVIGTFHYRDAVETPAAGEAVHFIARSPAVVDGQVITLPKKLIATLTTAGELPADFTLPTVAGGLFYDVHERVTGNRKTYTIQVLPTDTQIDLAVVAPVVPPEELVNVETAAVVLGAQAARDSADGYARAAESASVSAQESASAAEVSKSLSEAARDTAVGAASAAAGSASAAAGSASEASSSAGAASGSATAAAGSAGAASSAKDAAVAAQGAAESARNTAQGHAATATTKAGEAAASSAAAAATKDAVDAKFATLATVATSGLYADLSGTPTIPAAQVNSDWSAGSGVAQILSKPTLGDAAAKNVGTTAGTVAAGDDARLTDAREWTAATVTQAEAEAGTDIVRKAWTVQRVWQAIAAWWAASAAKTKLDGIAAGATVGADWSTNVTNKPTLGNSAALDVGTTAGTVAAGNDARLSDARTPTTHTHTAAQISDSTAVGRGVLTATDAAAARSAIGALATTGGTITGAVTATAAIGPSFISKNAQDDTNKSFGLGVGGVEGYKGHGKLVWGDGSMAMRFVPAPYYEAEVIGALSATGGLAVTVPGQGVVPALVWGSSGIKSGTTLVGYYAYDSFPGTNNTKIWFGGTVTASKLSFAIGNYTKREVASLNEAGHFQTTGPITAQKAVVASLPTGSEGMTAYATNGRKVGEGSGAGTGVPVYFSATKWRRYSDDTEVVA